jgi:hypothetical protein
MRSSTEQGDLKMNFWDRFESKQDGVEDTVEFVIRVAIVTLSAVILVVVMALAVGLFVPNDVVDSTAILATIDPAFQTVIGAFVGLLGGLSLNANARNKEAPLELTQVAPEPEPQPPLPEPIAPPTHEPPLPEVEDDDMAPWEKYRHDLRWDTNGDGVVDQADFPDWRNPEA